MFAKEYGWTLSHILDCMTGEQILLYAARLTDRYKAMLEATSGEGANPKFQSPKRNQVHGPKAMMLMFPGSVRRIKRSKDDNN